MVNETLALWAGCKYYPERPADMCWVWLNGDCRGEAPRYDYSRDLLPRLAEVPGAKVALAYALRDRVEHRIGTWEFVWYCLALPPADLAAAIAEVIDG